MKKKTKKQITKVVVSILAIFLLWLLIAFNLNLAEEAGSFLVKNHEAAVSIVTNVTDNIVFYSFLAALTTISYYFLRYKK